MSERLETAMELAIKLETIKIIEDSVKSGRFTRAGEMIDVAIQTLNEPELFGGFAPGELDRLIEEGERSGPPIPFDRFLFQNSRTSGTRISKGKSVTASDLGRSHRGHAGNLAMD